MVSSTLLFGLGNPILSDDALGLVLARDVYRELAHRHALFPTGLEDPEPPLGELADPWPSIKLPVEQNFGDGQAEIVGLAEAAVAGLAVLDVVCGWERVILMDSIQRQDGEPGTIYRYHLEDFMDTARMTSPHDLNLPSAIEFGASQGFQVPENIIIYAIEAEDVFTIREGMSQVVKTALPLAKDRILTEEFAL